MILLNILNSLVPTAAIALVAWGALRLLRANAATRYGVWWVVLASVVVMVLRPQNASVTALVVAPVELPPATSAAQDSLATWIVVAFVVWIGYALYRTARLVAGYVWLRRIVRDAQPWERSGVMLSEDVATPITAGFAHPVIILPAAFPEKLTAEELQHVLLHEEAHIARRDQWANLLARVVGVFFGLHPVAAFALHRIERERERACDDWVVAATGDARPYAASLTRVFELTRRGSQPDLASGFMGSRLGGRIEELLTQGRRFTKRASIAMLAVIVLPIVVGVRIGSHAPGLVAFAQEKQSVQPAKPATPTPVAAPNPAAQPKLAPVKDATADRLESLIARLEVLLDRLSPPAPEPPASTLQELMRQENALVQGNARLAAAQAEIKAREAEMADQRRNIEQLRLEVERAMQEMKAQQEMKAKQQANPQYR